MAISVIHSFVSAKADGPDSTQVNASDWNDEHAITLDSGKFMGRTSAGNGTVEELDLALVIGDNAFPAATPMLFMQTAAPTGWTKVTGFDESAIRVVDGVAGSGGTVNFSTVFGRTATDGYTLVEADIPAHTHSISITDPGHTHDEQRATTTNVSSGGGGEGVDAYETNPSGSSTTGITATASSTGGGGAHSHNIDLRVKYVDSIIATKD